MTSSIKENAQWVGWQEKHSQGVRNKKRRFLLSWGHPFTFYCFDWFTAIGLASPVFPIPNPTSLNDLIYEAWLGFLFLTHWRGAEVRGRESYSESFSLQRSLNFTVPGGFIPHLTWIGSSVEVVVLIVTPLIILLPPLKWVFNSGLPGRCVTWSWFSWGRITDI